MTETMDRNDNFSDEDHSDEDQEVIELTDILDGVVDDEDQEVIELTNILDGVVDDDVETDRSISTTMSERGMIRDDDSLLSDDGIEAALLRIVEKKYAGQLDALFVEAVERVVKREIEAIKQSLLKDL